MRFLIGILLGFAVGLAGAILFAPERRRGAAIWPEGHPARSLNGNKEGLKGAVRTLQEHVNEAWEEARIAASEAERKMMARYAEAAGREKEPETAPAGKK